MSGGKGTAAAKFEALNAAGTSNSTDMMVFLSPRSLFIIIPYHAGVTIVRSPDILGETMRNLFVERGIKITPK